MKDLVLLTLCVCLSQAVQAAYAPISWSRVIHYSKPRSYSTPASSYLADTPEVEAAKRAHFAEVAKRGGDVPYGYGYGYPRVTPEGFLEDTPEVAAAKALHFAEHARVAAAAARATFYLPYSYYPHHYPHYPHYFPFSLPGAPVVLPGGYLADTPEVAAAKILHFAEHAKAAKG